MNKARRNLWRRDPHCHWCGKKTLLLTPPSHRGLEPHPLLATRDHVYSKFQPEERERFGNPVVLSCFACNRRRNILETKWLAKQARTKTMTGKAYENKTLVSRDTTGTG
jgi:hypothetical protein